MKFGLNTFLAAIAIVPLLGLSFASPAGGQQRVSAASLEAAVERAFGRVGHWEYDALEDEWEYHYPGGEIEYEPEGQWPAGATTLEEAVRQEFERPGEWEYEPLQGEWEYEANGEVEYDPNNWSYRGAPYDYYEDGRYGDNWFYDWYDYRSYRPWD